MKPYSKIDTLFERDAQHNIDVTKIKRPEVEAFKLWQPTQKLHGTNIRILLSGLTMNVRGRSDAATVPPALHEWIINKLGPQREQIINQFPYLDETPVCLYGEGVGAGIQKGGGDYCPDQQFVLFDVKVGEGLLGWLDDDAVSEVASNLGLPRAHLFEPQTLDEIVAQTRVGWGDEFGKKEIAEGVVARPVGGPFYDRRGHRVIIKLKTEDFPASIHEG